MAVFNGYPATYQSPYYQQPVIPQVQNTQPQPQPHNSIIWVQGEAGAKSYLVAPNTTVQLWDSENQVIYLKSADASGMPSMKIIDYTIRGNEQSVNALAADTEYGQELASIKAKLAKLENEIQEIREEK